MYRGKFYAIPIDRKLLSYEGEKWGIRKNIPLDYLMENHISDNGDPSEMDCYFDTIKLLLMEKLYSHGKRKFTQKEFEEILMKIDSILEREYEDDNELRTEEINNVTAESLHLLCGDVNNE